MSDFLNNVHTRSQQFSASQKIVAAYIQDNLDRAAYMRANLMAEEVGTSSASVVRFAQSLGYSGYLDMQRAIQELVANRLGTTSGSQLEPQTEGHSASRAIGVSRSLDGENIEATFARLSGKGFEEAVACVQSAERIIFAGLKHAVALFTMFSDQFRVAGKSVVLLSLESPDAGRILDSLAERDLIFCVLLSANAKFVLDLVTSRSSSGVKIVLITDSSQPIDAKQLSAVLYVSTQSLIQAPSMVSTVSLLQAILLGVKLEVQNKPQYSPHLWILQEVHFQDQ